MLEASSETGAEAEYLDNVPTIAPKTGTVVASDKNHASTRNTAVIAAVIMLLRIMDDEKLKKVRLTLN